MLLAGLDVGNNNVKCVTEQGHASYLHALHKLTGAQVDALAMRNGEDESADVFQVNGMSYAIGEAAIRMGARTARYGEKRYTADYYGVLGAIALFKALEKNDSNRHRITLLATYTPKDDVYIGRIKAAIQGEWRIQNRGQSLVINVAKVYTTDEPVAHYRHTVLYAGGQSLREDMRDLRLGDCLILDVGGFTTGFAVAIDGKIDYTAPYSLTVGIQNALDELAKTIRSKHSDRLFGAQVLNPAKLRNAIMTGYYDAGGKGALDCRDLVETALQPIAHKIEDEYTSRYGGSVNYHSVLIAGGGGWLINKHLAPRLEHNNIFLSGRDSESMMFGAADGAIKTLQALQARGKL